MTSTCHWFGKVFLLDKENRKEVDVYPRTHTFKCDLRTFRKCGQMVQSTTDDTSPTHTPQAVRIGARISSSNTCWYLLRYNEMDATAFWSTMTPPAAMSVLAVITRFPANQFHSSGRRSCRYVQ